jgi:nucleoside diphosphate kinase
MTSAPVWLLVLSKIEAVTAWQYVLGPEDPMEARMAAPRRCVSGAAATAAGSGNSGQQ